jgi:hypothetical protein
MRPLKQRPDIGPAPTADLARKIRLEVGQANVIAPALGIHGDRVSAAIVRAIDDQPARSVTCSHFPEGDFLLALHGSNSASFRSLPQNY